MNIDLLDSRSPDLRHLPSENWLQMLVGKSAELSAEFVDMLPAVCRMVNSAGQVVWSTKKYQDLFADRMNNSCCGSLGLRHTGLDCPSHKTFQTAEPQRRTAWLGKLYVRIETAPLKNSDGGVIASFETLEDITTVKKLESALVNQQDLLETINKAMIETNHHLESAQQELEEKNSELENANEELRSLDKLKDEFISIVSHELKAPLTSIKGSVNLILSNNSAELSESSLKLLEICQRNVDRLTRLIKDLLDIARIDSGMMSFTYSKFSALQMVQECVQSQESVALQKNIDLRCRIAEDFEMEADRDRMIQVIVNLINNAIKFTDRGNITITAERVEDGVRFFVEDTGIGIPQDALKTIFDKFTQVGSPMHRNTNGTGLGLSIVRGIVREHGGEIAVSSEVGEGSCFAFVIPQPPRRPRESSRLAY